MATGRVQNAAGQTLVGKETILPLLVGLPMAKLRHDKAPFFASPLVEVRCNDHRSVAPGQGEPDPGLDVLRGLPEQRS